MAKQSEPIRDPVIRMLVTDSVKFTWDEEQHAYRVKALGPQNRNLLRYVGLKNNAPIPADKCDAKSLVALAEKIEEKAILQAKLYE